MFCSDIIRAFANEFFSVRINGLANLFSVFHCDGKI